jgi:hypothetical protein
LRDSDHVGQTIVNDFGRPFGADVNNVTGATVQGTASIFGFQG